VRIAIIGAGPTGLAAASRLQELGSDWALFEAEQHPGGLSASFAHDGFTWDLGGHIVFSHYRSYDAMLNAMLPPRAWIEHERRSFVRLMSRWVPYPFQNNIACLPPAEREECLAGLETALKAFFPEPPSNFQEWIDRNAGKGIARLFLNPYNAKVWAYPPETMSAHWLGDRVARPDIRSIRRSIESEDTDHRWGPNSTFRFPAQGGTGEIWRRLAATLDERRTHYGAQVVRVATRERFVTLADGRNIEYDALISTMPLDLLVALSDMPEMARQLRGLVHNSAYVIGYGLSGSIPKEAGGMCWLYFPEPEDPFYRVTMFSHYSPANAPAGCYSVMAEVAESPVKTVNRGDVVASSLERLRAAGLVGAGDRVVSCWVKRLERAYPVPSLGRDAALEVLRPALEARSVYSRGRFGAWKYEVGNQDHCFAQGLECAERLTRGGGPELEPTLHAPAVVNSRRNP